MYHSMLCRCISINNVRNTCTNIKQFYSDIDICSLCDKGFFIKINICFLLAFVNTNKCVFYVYSVSSNLYYVFLKEHCQ